MENYGCALLCNAVLYSTEVWCSLKRHDVTGFIMGCSPLRDWCTPLWFVLYTDIDQETFGDAAGGNDAGDLPDFFGNSTSGDQEFSRWD